ncbi:DUF4091 domain-containing protein [Microlunatus sp. GCM10028923]|uniref:DUF4091 domain-containing protein n=1 Tax=Microlunatus sp. GCM10028923 TaxID=3273400 RepID=UPI003612EB28
MVRNHGLRRTTPVLLGLALIATLLVAVSGPARAAGPGVWQDYETDEAVAATTVSVPGHDAATRVPYGSHGESGLEFTVAPTGTPGSTASSAVTLNAGTAAMPDNDWSGHDWLAWDFWMPTDYTTNGRITIRDTHNVAWGVNYAIRGRGWTAVHIKLADVARAGVDVSSIKYLGISIPRRAEPVKGYYDALRLVDGTPDDSPFGNRVVQNLVRQVDFGSILDGVDADLAEAATLLGDEASPSYADMKAQIDGLAADAAAIRDGLSSITTVEQYNTMIKTLATLVAAPERLTQILTLRQGQPKGHFGLDTADSMSLVYPKDKTWPGTGTAPTLELARGEAEHVQAVVVPYGIDLNEVRVSIDGVRGPDGKPVPADALAATVAPIGSLYTVPSSAYGRPTYTGWTPDPIRADLSTVDIPAGDVQPYLVSAEAARDLKPGSYKITVRVRADGQPDQRLAIAVTVWPLTPKDRPELRTAFQFTPWLAWELYGMTDPAEREAMRLKYWDFLAEHKIQPDQIYTTANNPADPGPGEIRPQPAADILKIKERYGLTQFTALYLWAGLLDPSKPETWDTQIDIWIGQLETAMAEYEKAGIADNAVVYGFDESTGPMLQAAKHTFTRIKERFPNLPIMTTLRDDTFGQNTGLTDQVDIWVPWIDGYRQDVAEAARARGERIWWYHAISTNYPQPNWFNGYPPIDTRMLMGAMSHQANVEGILYYATNRWPKADRGDQLLVDDGILSKWNPATFYGTAGDGSLYYPGADGPMSSLRFENVRDGLEDYNLMQELRRAIKAHPDAPSGLIERAEKALGARDVVTDSRHFTEDPVAYRAWRHEVAETAVLLGRF